MLKFITLSYPLYALLLVQVLFTHDTLSLLSLGGAMLVTTGITVIVVCKRVVVKPAADVLASSCPK
jgi:drug/metabolite transporter (DMT)-like permease